MIRKVKQTLVITLSVSALCVPGLLKIPAVSAAEITRAQSSAANSVSAKSSTIDAPEAADEVTYYIYDTDIACIDFTLDKQSYQLMASRKDGDFSGCTGSVISSEHIDSRYNAIMYIMDTGIKLNWSDGSAQFYLTSQDNSNSDSVKKVFSSIISNR